MADPPAEVVEQIFEPSAVAVQHGPPSAYPWLFTFTGEDVLELTSWNSAANVRIVIAGRVHTPDGTIKPFEAKHTPATTRTPVTTVHTIPRGDLLNLIMYCDAGAPVLFQTFARVAVRRGAGDAFTRLGVLVQGTISASSALAFPGSPIERSVDGEGFHRAITGTMPAAGAQIAETVPAGARWEIVNVFLGLTTSAVAHGIFVNLAIGSAGGTKLLCFCSQTQAQSLGWFYNFGAGLAQSFDTVVGRMQLSLPNDLIALAGETIQVNATFAAAGDQFSAPVLSVREWLDI